MPGRFRIADITGYMPPGCNLRLMHARANNHAIRACQHVQVPSLVGCFLVLGSKQRMPVKVPRFHVEI